MITSYVSGRFALQEKSVIFTSGDIICVSFVRICNQVPVVLKAKGGRGRESVQNQWKQYKELQRCRARGREIEMRKATTKTTLTTSLNKNNTTH